VGSVGSRLRPSAGGRAPAWRVAVALVFLLAGLLLATTRSAAQGGELRGSGTTRLSDLVRTAQRGVDAAEAQRAQLIADVDAAQRSAANYDAGVTASLAQADELRSAAGLTPLAGRGLTVTLTDARRDADGKYPAGAAPDDLVVHQQDLQSVLNAMWAGGADAVAVQNQRLVSTSAPRCIGNTLLLHGRTYSPPYVVAAIGDPNRLLDALNAERGVAIYKQYVTRFGLGYLVDTADDVTVPAYTGSIRLSQAQEVPR
jgi:uncharacterized protein YlxW (UPF0749 family)